MKRVFAFGCSFTNYAWPSMADFVGASADEYYNYGTGGACNTYIMNQLLEQDDFYKFNPETDFILVGISGIMRHSFLNNDDTWTCTGDIYPVINPGHPKNVQWFAKNMFNGSQAVYDTYIAIKAIRLFLETQGIDHFIYPAIDNSPFLKMPELFTNKTLKMLDGVCNEFNFPSLEERARDFDTYQFKDGHRDGHPSMEAHLAYAKEHLPSMINDKSYKLFNDMRDNFNYNSIKEQGFLFHSNYANKYRKN